MDDCIDEDDEDDGSQTPKNNTWHIESKCTCYKSPFQRYITRDDPSIHHYQYQFQSSNDSYDQGKKDEISILNFKTPPQFPFSPQPP